MQEGYPRFLNRKNKIYQILGSIDVVMVEGWESEEGLSKEEEFFKNLVQEKGYVYGDSAYIYKGEIESSDEIKDSQVNAFYKVPFKNTGKAPALKSASLSKVDMQLTIDNPDFKATYLFVKSYIESEKEAFQFEHLAPADLQSIGNEIDPDEELYDAETICNINAATSSYVPEVTKEDDFLKKIVKFLLIITKTDINKFKALKPEKYWLTNFKTALKGTTKMSTTNFRVWSELIGANFAIIAYPDKKAVKNGTKFTPLIYSSENDEVYIMENLPGIEFDGKTPHMGEFMDKVYKNCTKINISVNNGVSNHVFNIKDEDDETEVDY